MDSGFSIGAIGFTSGGGDYLSLHSGGRLREFDPVEYERKRRRRLASSGDSRPVFLGVADEDNHSDYLLPPPSIRQRYQPSCSSDHPQRPDSLAPSSHRRRYRPSSRSAQSYVGSVNYGPGRHSLPSYAESVRYRPSLDSVESHTESENYHPTAWREGPLDPEKFNNSEFHWYRKRWWYRRPARCAKKDDPEAECCWWNSRHFGPWMLLFPIGIVCEAVRWCCGGGDP